MVCGTRGRRVRESADRRPRLTIFPQTFSVIIRSIRMARSISQNWQGFAGSAERRRINISGYWRGENGREWCAPCRLLFYSPKSCFFFSSNSSCVIMPLSYSSFSADSFSNLLLVSARGSACGCTLASGNLSAT